MNDRARAERLSSWHARLSGAATLGLGAVYFAIDDARPALTLENELLENATAVSLAAGALIGFVAFWRRRGRRRMELALPLCALAALLDEVSFGQGLFGFQLPELRGFPIDGLHDLFLVAYSIFETENRAYLAIYAVLAVCAVGATVWLARPGGALAGVRRRVLSSCVDHPSFRYLALAVVFLASTLFLDLDLVESHWLLFLEELLELQAALALAFGGAAIGLSLPWTVHRVAGAGP